MSSPKVLVGCPTAELKEYCITEYLAGVRALTWPAKDLVLVDNSPTAEYAERLQARGVKVYRDTVNEPDVRKRIANSRNMLRKIMLEQDYDYFFSLEQDVIPPPDAIERLLAHNKPVVSGVYFTIYEINGVQRMRPVLWAKHSNPEQMTFMNKEVRDARGKPADLHEVRAAGVGCVLIRRDVLKQVSFRATEQTHDDIPFYKDCAAHGFTPYADLALVCKHMVQVQGQTLVLPP